VVIVKFSVVKFYSDPTIFESLHKSLGMVDIARPDWCETNVDFINYHRRLLEGNVVSSMLHLWIDLNFGSCLSGSSAVKEKNVPMHVTQWGAAKSSVNLRSSVENSLYDPYDSDVFSEGRSGGPEGERGGGGDGGGGCRRKIREEVFVQLFPSKHPRRQCGSEGRSLTVTRRSNTQQATSIGARARLSSDFSSRGVSNEMAQSNRYLRTLSYVETMNESEEGGSELGRNAELSKGRKAGSEWVMETQQTTNLQATTSSAVGTKNLLPDIKIPFSEFCNIKNCSRDLDEYVVSARPLVLGRSRNDE